MLRRFLLGIMVVSMATLAWAGIPDPANCSVTGEAPAGSLVHILPNGTGTPLNFIFSGPRPTTGNVDGTITLTVRDANGVPVFDYSWEDLWLEIDGVAFCPALPPTPNGGATNTEGVTFWSGNLFGGGSGEGIHVVVGGTRLTTTVPYAVNSPDANGDLFINVSDVAPFFGAWLSTAAAFDFNWDNIVNVSDVAPLFGAWGSTCPINP